MTEDQIKHMVGRFLQWKLPENFNPDAGISFQREFNTGTPYPMKHEPMGTNLLDATQAAEMVRFMLDGLEAAKAAPDGAVASGAEVRPLEWLSSAWNHRSADRYVIEDMGSDWPSERFWLAAHGILDNVRLGKFDTLDEAKAAAQADHEARIRSALTTPAPTPSAKAFAWAYRQKGSAHGWRLDTRLPSFSSPDAWEIVALHASPAPQGDAT